MQLLIVLLKFDRQESTVCCKLEIMQTLLGEWQLERLLLLPVCLCVVAGRRGR
jgi:hypothetical protein